jgi:hypothetical protein
MIQAFEVRHINSKPIHVTVSIPQSDWGLSVKKICEKAKFALIKTGGVLAAVSFFILDGSGSTKVAVIMRC